jgi:hypothetical protein
MKSGASDPFGGEEDASAESSADGVSEEAAEVAETEPDAETDVPEEPDTADSDGDDDPVGLSRAELPYVLRRERVKDERPEVHQLFVQQETHERAVDAERTLQDDLGVDLSRTDAREAIYLAGMAHLDEAADILREWGYDL